MAKQLRALTLKTQRPEVGALKTLVTWASRRSGDRRLTDARGFQPCKKARRDPASKEWAEGDKGHLTLYFGL